MKASFLRRNSLGALFLAALLFSCGDGMKKYEWLASESAPKGYPMTVVRGDFYDSKGGRLYIPDGKTMHDGWGVEVSRHIVGDDKKYLPNRFDILYFSYTEDTFYQGAFDLPAERIAKLFGDGYYSPNYGKNITYRMIIVGVAPGGTVSVWVDNANKTTEVFSGTAEKVEAPWELIYSGKRYSRSEFIALDLEEQIGQEGIQRIKQNGIPQDLWKKYRKRFNWKPLITGASKPKVLNQFEFFNGEVDYFSEAHGNDWTDEPKAVPRELHFVWKHKSDIPLAVEVKLDENEIFEAFETLAEDNDDEIIFNIDIEQIEDKLYYHFNIQSGEKSIRLEKGSYEQHRAALSGDRLKQFLKEN